MFLDEFTMPPRRDLVHVYGPPKEALLGNTALCRQSREQRYWGGGGWGTVPVISPLLLVQRRIIVLLKEGVQIIIVIL